MERVRRRLRKTVQMTIAFVILLANCAVQGSAEGSDLPLCNLINQPIYCSCEQDDGIRTDKANCYVIQEIDNDDPVFKAFAAEEHLTYVAFSSFGGKKQLNFVPDAPLLYSKNTLQQYKISQGDLGIIRSNTFFEVPKLVLLSLDSNEITDLESHAFSNLPSLKKLELGDNQLKIIRAGALYELPNLEFLFLDRNQITSIEDYAFSSMPNLTELALADNDIEELTANTFYGLRRITRIDLFRNKLKQLVGHVFSNMSFLQELDLKSNDISEVDPLAFHNLPHLRIIYLANNRLRILPANMFMGAPNLVLIDFSENQLQTLTWRTIEDLTRINSEGFDLLLKGNKLACDCRIAWILHLAETTKDQNFRRELRHIKCDFRGPNVTTSSKVARLTKEQLNCPANYAEPTFATTPLKTPPPTSGPSPTTTTTRYSKQNEHLTADSENTIQEKPPAQSPTKEDATVDDDDDMTNEIHVVHDQQKAANTDPVSSRNKNGSGSPAFTVPSCAVLHVMVTILVSFAMSR
ncbi:connectin-like [Ornithodoros turicata]|uniref:connectin-like n=1 Tax=Ornithodoros turicata TaxID=34597 RepID=UPI00313A11A9